MNKQFHKNLLARTLYITLPLFLIFQQIGTTVYAMSDAQKDVLNSGIDYFDVGSSCSGGGTTTAVSGTVSPQVGKGMSPSAQQQFQQIVVGAGKKNNVDPNFVAAFYYLEDARTGDSTNNADSASGTPVTGDGNWREPAPPIGNGSPYVTNGLGYSEPYGLNQGDIQSLGEDGDGDGTISATDLADAAFTAAHYLANDGATVGASDTTLYNVAYQYNHSTTYAQSAMNTYHYLTGQGSTSVSGSASSCSSSTTTASGGFTNPFPGGWVPNRLDMGYDGTFKGQIVAPCDGTITYAGPFNGWNGSSGVIIKCDNDIGFPVRSLYFTEGVGPITQLQGQHVSAGTPIANPVPSPYGAYAGTGTSVGAIEWGVSQDGPVGQQVDTYAVAVGFGGKCAPSAQSKAMVLKFYQWAQQTLQVPGNTTDPGCAGAS